MSATALIYPLKQVAPVVSLSVVYLLAVLVVATDLLALLRPHQCLKATALLEAIEQRAAAGSGG